MADRVCVAAIAGPIGLRGELRVKGFTAEPAAIGDYGPLSGEDGRVFELEVVRPLKGDLVVARIAGVSDRDAAEALKGTRLYVARAALPPPEPEEYYHADLIGLDVVDRSDRQFGVVHAVHDFGAGDVIEVLTPTGRQPVLLPFTRELVLEVDLDRHRLVIDPPFGSFEALASPEDDGEDDEDKEGQR